MGIEHVREEGSFVRCPHCDERPAAAHHLCPLNLETLGCECCGVCAKTCADIARHIEEHTAIAVVHPDTGEMSITYIEPEDADDPGDWDNPPYGLTA